ncbi:MAG: hypothetical protein ACRCT8_02445 [Lacipirellulaceae bacterium]
MPLTSTRRAALVVAHPAHELRLLGWIDAVRPLVCVLTDGSGRAQRPRIATTDRLLKEFGAERGPVFGQVPDLRLYATLLDGEHDPLLRTADRLADCFVREAIDTVVVDAVEDAILAHDVVNAVTRAAVVAASARSGRAISVYDFSLEQSPEACPADRADGALWLRLDERQLEQKLSAAWSYAEVRDDVEEAFAAFGHHAFAVECLRRVRDLGAVHTPQGKPVYERHGERLLRAGHYKRVIRYEDHVRPLLEKLANSAPLVALPKAA